MDIYTIAFYLFAVITVVSAYFVVTTKNIIYAAYNLLVTFFGVAGIYVLLGADFIAIVQLIIYVGGILILILFGVMLTNKITNVDIRSESSFIFPASVVIGLFSGVLLAAVLRLNISKFISPGEHISARELGVAMLNEYTLVFLILGVLLLIALVGAANLARR